MSGDVRAWLDYLDQARADASKAPFGTVGGTHDRVIIDDHGCHVATTGTFPDAALIVAAVNALPRLTAALRAVLDLADELELSTGLDYATRFRAADRIRAAVADALGDQS